MTKPLSDEELTELDAKQGDFDFKYAVARRYPALRERLRLTEAVISLVEKYYSVLRMSLESYRDGLQKEMSERGITQGKAAEGCNEVLERIERLVLRLKQLERGRAGSE